jgi:phage/plasmid-associated DNA primase
MGVLKDITGGGSINARTLYSKNCECLLENITSFICNERPNIGGDIGDAEMRRFINIPYEQKYSTNEEKIAKGYKRANLYYKTKEFQEDNKVHLFNYLLTHSYIEPYIPKCISEETQKYLLGSDNTSAYFDDKVEFTEDENDMLTLRDLTDIYKEQFSMGSRDYRSATAKKVKEMLQRNIKWGEKWTTDFNPRLILTDENGKPKEITNVILKVRRIIEKDPEPTNT